MVRWEGDERGRGVGSAADGIEELDRLRAAMQSPDWVAEDPDVHLLPHVERICADRGWHLRRAEVVEAVLELEIATGGRSRGELRLAALTIVGSFAESSTHVVEQPNGASSVDLVVTTGMLDGDSGFAPHGHVVRLSVRET